MSACDLDAPPPEHVVVDGYLVDDVRWLVSAVEEFALHGDPSSIHQLIEYANPRLSPDGFSRIAGQLALGLRRAIEASR